MEQQPRLNPFESLSPIQVFIFGVVEGILVLCTIGFFILLSWYLKGNTPSFGFGGGAAPAATPAPAGAAPAAPAIAVNVQVRPVDAKNDHIRGAKNPKVTIVEFSDLECPFCKRFHETMKQVISAYPKDVAWVYRHFPLDSLHSQARKEAMATECAAEQGKFWEYTDLIFQETPSNNGLDLAKLPDYARRVGLNVNRFQECFNSQKYAGVIQSHEADAQAAGGQGTPYSVAIGANGQKVPISGAYPLDQVKSTIDSLISS